jgi:hypothetical protein
MTLYLTSIGLKNPCFLRLSLSVIGTVIGTVISTVLSTRKFHRGHHDIRHMNNCRINEISIKLKQLTNRNLDYN